MEQAEKLVVIGQGYVGLPLSMLAVEAGWEVVGLELDASRVARLRAGDSYIDDIPDSRLRAAVDSGRYRPSGDYADAAGFRVAVITVPTPLREHSPDLSYITGAGEMLSPYVTQGCLVVLESTTYPGTTEEILRPILERDSGLAAGRDFALAYSPERVDPGNPVWTLTSTPKVVSGIDEASLQAVTDFYGKLINEVVPVSSTQAAELTKLLENTFRHVNIALVNEFAIFARELGADPWEVVRAAATKPFGFMPFRPGPGVGGHCLPIDPHYLSWRVQHATGRRFRLVELANDINEQMPGYVMQRITRGLNDRGKAVRGSRVLLLGLAYKKNSSDARESPATEIARTLAGLGAKVSAVDPHVDPAHVGPEITLTGLTAQAVRAADAVVLLTDHDDFDLGLIEREAGWVLDTCDRLAGANIEPL